jgi:protein ImuA
LATLAEVFSEMATDSAATGFVLAHLATGVRVLWVQDRLSRREGGRPHLPGIAGLLGGPLELLHLEVPRAVDVLWAMEQALSCPALAAVVGEVWGDPPALDLTATKRLALRAERGGVAAWLLRRAATPDLSAARKRWRVASLPSLAAADDPHAPGETLWRANLFRSRHGRPGEWLARRDSAQGGLVLAPNARTEAGREAPLGRRGPKAA